MLHCLGASLLFRIARTHKNTYELGRIKIAEHYTEHNSDRNSKDGAKRTPQPSPECQGDKDKYRTQVEVGSLDARLNQVTHELLDSQVEQEH